jgi:hypothetical protein
MILASRFPLWWEIVCSWAPYGAASVALLVVFVLIRQLFVHIRAKKK